jgi:hypothetical protein
MQKQKDDSANIPSPARQPDRQKGTPTALSPLPEKALRTPPKTPQFQNTPERTLGKLRDMLAPVLWKVVGPNDGEVNFGNFASNIRDCAAVTLQRDAGDEKDIFFIVFTERNIWLIYSTPHETLHDHYKSLMNVNLMRRTVLESVAEPGKMRYISRLSPSDLEDFCNAAASCRVKEPAQPKPVADTLVPSGPGMDVDLDGFREKIRASSLVMNNLKEFTLGAFADSIRFVGMVTDEDSHPHYVIFAGKEENTYKLYINCFVAPAPGFIGFARFIYDEKENCILYRED